MAERYWETYVKPIRDALVAAIKAKAAENNVTIQEVKAGIHGSRERFAATGIYILPPGGRPANGDQLTPTEAYEWDQTFPVFVFCRGLHEPEQLELISRLAGVVVDAVEGQMDGPAPAMLDGLVEAAWIAEDGPTTVTIGAGVGVAEVEKTITIQCRITRTFS